MTIMRTGLLAAGVLLGLISAAAATDPPVFPASPAGGQPITLTDAQLDEALHVVAASVDQVASDFEVEGR